MNLHRVRTVIRRHWYVLWRSPNRWFDIAAWPLLDVILFGSLGAFVAEENGASRAGASYLLAGILLFHVTYQVQMALATGFMEETWTRNVLNIMTTPVTELEYVVALAAFGLLKLVMALGTLSLFALVFFSFGLGEIGFALIPITAVLILTGWSVALVVIGLMLRFGQSAEITTWGINFLLLALSGVFYPLDALPGAFRPLAELVPTSHAFTAVREVLDGRALPWDEIAAGLALSVVLGAVSVAFVVQMLRLFRRRGLVTRFS